MTEEPQDYVRYVLHSAGFTNPTDEIVNEIYATALRSGAVVALHPYVIVDALVSLLHAYYPATKSLEFIESMQQLQSQVGHTQEELATLSQAILDMAVIEPEAKPIQKVPYYQRNKAQWWKGRKPV